MELYIIEHYGGEGGDTSNSEKWLFQLFSFY